MVLSLLLRRCIFGLAFSYVHLVQMRQCRRQQQLADPVNDGIPKGYGKWRNGNFQKAKSKYPRFKCSVKCGSRTRRFCTCDPSTILCEKCFSCHFAEVFALGRIWPRKKVRLNQLFQQIFQHFNSTLCRLYIHQCFRCEV